MQAFVTCTTPTGKEKFDDYESKIQIRPEVCMKLLERVSAYARLRQYQDDIADTKAISPQTFETQERIRVLEKDWKELRNKMITLVTE